MKGRRYRRRNYVHGFSRCSKSDTWYVHKRSSESDSRLGLWRLDTGDRPTIFSAKAAVASVPVAWVVVVVVVEAVVVKAASDSLTVPDVVLFSRQRHFASICAAVLMRSS